MQSIRVIHHAASNYAAAVRMRCRTSSVVRIAIAEAHHKITAVRNIQFVLYFTHCCIRLRIV